MVGHFTSLALGVIWVETSHGGDATPDGLGRSPAELAPTLENCLLPLNIPPVAGLAKPAGRSFQFSVFSLQYPAAVVAPSDHRILITEYRIPLTSLRVFVPL